MSASLSIAATPLPSPAVPVPVTAAAPRRTLSAARMVRLVMTTPRFADALMVGAVPYGAEIVLRAIAVGIAKSGELGVFRPPPGPFTAEAVLGARMGLLGAEAAIGADLGKLLEAGMVVRRDDGALTLPLDFEALTRPVRPRQALAAGELDHLSPRHRAAIENGSKGGAPTGPRRRGVPTEGQRNLRLFSTVAAPLGYETGTQGGTHGVTQDRTQGEVRGETQGASEIGLGTSWVSSVGYASRAELEDSAAAVSGSGAIHDADEAAAAAALSSARVHANPRAGETENPSGENPSGENPLGENPRDENPSAENPSAGDAGFRQNPSRAADAGSVTQAACDLAAKGAAAFGWRGQSAKAAPAIIQRQLDAGYDPATIAAVMDEHAGREINGARFFDRVLESRGVARPLASAGAAERPPQNGAIGLMVRAREAGMVLPDLPP